MCMPLAQFEQHSMRIPVFYGATALLVTPESQRGQLACDCELFLTVVPFCSTCMTLEHEIVTFYDHRFFRV